MPGIQGQPHYSFIHPIKTAWMDQAACQHHPDTDWFDTECGLMAAASICYGCPVKSQCLDYAIDIEATDGIWAGLWGKQLEAMIQHRIRSRS